MTEDTTSIVSQLVKDINKKYEMPDLVTTLQSEPLKIDSISTQLPYLDYMLGVGGIPRGRITELFGHESSAKSTLCLYVVAECQKQGGIAAFIDTEHSLDLNYAKLCGVDLENMLFSQPDSGEQALELVEQLARTGKVDLIIVDSVASLVPTREVEGDMGDNAMGVTARLMAQAMRKLQSPIKKNNVALVFTNQIRHKIGVMFGSPETTPGGLALKFSASVRIRLSKTKKIEVKLNEGDKAKTTIGSIIKFSIIKNKCAPPFKIGTFDLLFGEAPDSVGNLALLALELKIIQTTGAGNYYFVENEEADHVFIAKGKLNLSKTLKENQELMEKINKIIKELI